jgi:hypothetical protein
MPGSRRAVESIVVNVSNNMYAPTAATAGERLCHHHTQVVPNHVPEIPSSSVRDAMKA